MLRLLIIDDETAIRNGIAAYFPWANLGIEVAATCKDGLDALSVMETEKFDLILCDIRMPRMDGIRFAEEVRRRGYPCDIVFISAHKDFDYAKKAIELGVREYIVKPAGYDELHETFSKIAKEHEAKTAVDIAQREPVAGSPFPPAPLPSSIPKPGTSLAERVARLLERDLVEVSLSLAASELDISPNYLSAKLHQETGKTFTELLIEARMQRARLLLSDPGNRVGRVSAMVGYANTKSFIRAFRHYFGDCPTALRFADRDSDQERSSP